MLYTNSNDILNLLENQFNNLAEFISPITDSDNKLFETKFSQVKMKDTDNLFLNFEDSFEYIRMYFNSGRYHGYKFYDGQELIIFALEKKKKLHFKLFKPFENRITNRYSEVICSLIRSTKFPIQLVCLNNKLLTELKKVKNIVVKNTKEFKYYIYDLELLNDLHGNQWKNVRQKINTFKKDHSKIKVEHLNENNSEDTVHFIGEWRRVQLSSRGCSYASLEKNKFAARYYSNKNNFKNIWAYIYKLSGKIVAFQLLYRLGPAAAAHAIGLADTNKKGLSEFAQIHIWEELKSSGIRYINDGASWRPGLSRYKEKFNPINVQHVFECKIKPI